MMARKKAESGRRTEKPHVRDLREAMRGACPREMRRALRAVRRCSSWQEAWDKHEDGWQMEYLLWHIGRGPYARPVDGTMAETVVTKRFRRAFEAANSRPFSVEATDDMSSWDSGLKRCGKLPDLADLIRSFWPRAPRLPRAE